MIIDKVGWDGQFTLAKVAALKKEGSRVNMADAMDLYLAYQDKHRSPGTVSNTKYVLNNFAYFTLKHLQDLNVVDERDWIFAMADLIQKWRDHLPANGKKDGQVMPRSPNRAVVLDSVLHAFFNWCFRYQLVSYNPYNFLRPMPAPVKKRFPLYTLREYETMKAKAKRATYYMVVCGFRTGMSLVDVCTLKWEEVSMEYCFIRRIRTKQRRFGNKSECLIPFTPGGDLYLCLKQLKEASPFEKDGQEYVCPIMARRYHQNAKLPSQKLRELLEICGIKGKNFITFRRTFLSAMANSGMNLGLAMKISGHVNTAMFANYILPDIKSLHSEVKGAFDKMEQRENESVESFFENLNHPPQGNGAPQLVHGDLPAALDPKAADG